MERSKEGACLSWWLLNLGVKKNKEGRKVNMDCFYILYFKRKC